VRAREIKEITSFLDEGRRYIEIGDAVPASEKLYKAAEEAVKSLSRLYAPEVYNEAKAKDRWTAELLFRAVREIAAELDSGVRHSWNAAWTLHVQGFHEGRLDIDYISGEVKDIEELVKLAEEKSS
jgi:hypothetical protein